MATTVLTFDNLGEASELERGTWDGDATPLGRHPSVTVALPRLLDELDAHELRATFCVEAINCELNPEAVTGIARRGHELAGHGWRHEPWSELDPTREAELLARSRSAFDTLSIPVAGFRPPGGGLTAADPGALTEHGFTWCSPELDAVPLAGSRDADGPPAWVPFAWELVDAYLLMDIFAALRTQRGADRAPATPAQAGRRLNDGLAAPGEARTLIMHPFLMLDEPWWEQAQSILARIAADRDSGAAACITAGEAARSARD